MTAFPYLIQGSNIVVVIDSKPHTVSKTHPTYEKVKEAIKAGAWDDLRDIIEPKQVVLNYGKGNVSVQGEQLFWKGKPLHDTLASRMIEMLKEDFPIEPMVNFMENKSQNSSNRSVTELYGFMEKGNMPITPDGCFLAYKKVKSNYMDVHSGTVLNKPAYLMTQEEKDSLATAAMGKKQEVTVEIINGVTTVSMPRNEVNDDKDQTCSEGLHFCSEGYLENFSGDRIVILKINPRDVVSIPSDYKDTKGRTCRYEVIGEVPLDTSDKVEFTKSVQSNANSMAPKGPKLGNSAFYRGYTDGFTGEDFNDDQIVGEAGQPEVAYGEGFDKGQDDRELGNERYRLSPKHVRDTTGAWPAPR